MTPLLRALLAAAFFVALALPADAQQRTVSASSFAIGGQIGDPSGLTIRTPARGYKSWTGLLAFDTRDYVFGAVHRIYEQPISDSPLGLFYGPGIFVGARDGGNRRSDDTVLGISLDAGVNFYLERFEIYLQLTPGLTILPGTNGFLDAAVGLRYAL